jgi:hypothetical protein
MNVNNIPPGWMIKKAARIARDYSRIFTMSKSANMEQHFPDLLFRACGLLLGEAKIFPKAAKLLPADLLQALYQAPSGHTLGQLERVSIIILDHDATQAANALELISRPQDQEEFIALKFWSLSWLLGGGQE